MEKNMPSHWKKASPEKVDFFYQVLKNHPDVEKRKMFGYPCAFIRGNMFFGLFEDSIFLRLSENDRQEILASGEGAAFEPLPGRVMKEYMTLSPKTTSNSTAFEAWFSKSWEFTSSLPPKEKKGGKK
jgi:TfoX/Sxy family transcriptional regulator of competence genes